MLRDDVPWGRAPVARLPVPPFADVAQFRTFHLALAEHLTCLAGAGGRMDVATFAVLSALADVDHAVRDERADAPLLAPWVLRIAITTYFPAPWTPWGLVTAMDRAGLVAGARWYTGERHVGYGGDPDFDAERGADGRWTVRSRERGEVRVDAELAGDDDMVLYLMSHVRRNAYPLGWRVQDEQRLAAIAERAPATVAAWEQHAQLAYIRRWIDR